MRRAGLETRALLFFKTEPKKCKLFPSLFGVTGGK